MGKRSGVYLSKAEIKKIEPGEKIQRVWDLATRGLGIQVTPAGVYSWVLSYRIDGKKDMTTLGRWPEMTVEQAQKAALARWGDINEGKNPNEAKNTARKAAEEARRAATIGDLIARFKKDHLPHNAANWQKESARLLDKHVAPALGKLRVRDAAPMVFSEFLENMKEKTPTQANRTKAVLRVMFCRAEEWGYRDSGSNPISAVKVKGKEVKRDRRLSDLELKKLGEAMRGAQEAPAHILGIRLALLAGMRKGEIQTARWEWLDLDAAEIRIPADFHKTGHKTGKVRVIHLCSALVEELRTLPKLLGCPHIIPGHAKTDPTTQKTTWHPFTALQNPWERLREAAKLSTKGEPKEEDPGLHDLRRTFASVASDLGLRGFAGELLGHAEKDVTDIYTRTAAAKLLEAVETIGARIDGILTGKFDPEEEAKARTQERAKAKEKKSG